MNHTKANVYLLANICQIFPAWRVILPFNLEKPLDKLFPSKDKKWKSKKQLMNKSMLPTLRVEQKEELVVLEAPEGKRMNKKYNESVRGRTQHVAFLDTKGLSEVDFPSLPSKEEMSKELQDFYEKKPYNSFPT